VRRRLLAVLATGLVLAGCGIPTSRQASVVPPKDVPFHLLSPVVPSTTTTTSPQATTASEPIYLVKGADSLTGVVRQVVTPATLGAVLDTLLVGPTPAETATGLSSSLPSNLRVISTSQQGSTATIVLNRAFIAISGPDQVLAVAQLVLTATRQPGISGVLFAVAGNIVPVPTASGASTTAPVTAGDYAPLLSF
jgi:spore germination protein GerM